MNKCIILFVEGQTEVEFYNKIISYIKEQLPNKKFNAKIDCINIEGVCGFKKEALKKFKKEIQIKYKNHKFIIFCCLDSDVFEGSQQPPINLNKIQKDLKTNGADEVFIIQAVHTIEDWFLLDSESILLFLKLKPTTNINGKNGLEKIKNIYKKANKTYLKGGNTKGFIEKLNINKIIQNKEVKEKLKPLFDELNFNFL